MANRNLVVQKHALLIKYDRITILGRLRFTRPMYISVILGVSRANGVSAAIGDYRGFLPIGGRDRTLADHNK